MKNQKLLTFILCTKHNVMSCISVSNVTNAGGNSDSYGNLEIPGFYESP